MNFRSILSAAVAASFLAWSPLVAAEEKKEERLIPGTFSATLSGVTDYRFRGVSQTDNIPAVQGSFDWEMPLVKDYMSVFLGVWASNVNFKDGGDAVIEIDVYGGLKGTIDKFSWKLQFIGYLYPGAPSYRKYDYFEINPEIGYDFDFLAVSAGINYSPQYFGKSGDAVYFYTGVTVPIPIAALEKYKPAFVGSVGYQAIQRNAVYGTPDYWTWTLGVQAEFEGFTFAVKYVDTDISKANCVGGRRWCGATGIFSVTKTFSW